MANRHITHGDYYKQLALLIHQIDSLSQTLLILDETISNELKLVENGQLYFTLAKVKSKCEQMKESKGILGVVNDNKYEMTNAENSREANSSQPFQQFLRKYQDAFNINDLSNKFQKSTEINKISPNKEMGFWKVQCDNCQGNHFAVDCKEGLPVAEGSPSLYYDKSKSFFDKISNNDQLKKTKFKFQNMKKKNIETFGPTECTVQFTHDIAQENVGAINKEKSVPNDYNFNLEINTVPSHLKQLATECIQLLKTSFNGTLSFKDFVVKYYEYFGYKVEDVEKKRKLLELLQDMPSIVAIIRKPNEELYVELVAGNSIRN